MKRPLAKLQNNLAVHETKERNMKLM